MTSKKTVFKALVRSDFRVFVEKVFVTLSPGQSFIPSWHIGAIGWQLERVRRGECRRLIINLPPRSLKSIAASVAFPAFVLGHDPSKRIICVSYSGDLAKKHANDFRAVLESDWYREFFPCTRVGPFKNSEAEIELTERGFRLATSVGGTLTGRGGGTNRSRRLPGGAMIKRHWVKRYRELPPQSERLLTLQSWDTASKRGPENDWSVCTTWMLARGKNWYLLDV
jgi:hypothetical protein